MTSGPRLSIIPARACTDPALKPRDLQVLCVMGRHTDNLGWCRLSQVKMAAAMGCARSTVFDAIERLVNAGYVERFVQEEDSGRDSSHVYRVVLDPPGSPSNLPEDDADTPAGIPAPPAGISAPPAGIPAPPAGISAPPAGPGPAPKNDPSRTIERERGREAGQEAVSAANRETGHDDPKKVEADGWALLKNWPGFDGMPKEPAMAIWRTLSADDRATARRRFLPWLELLRKQKKNHVPAPSTYLRERLFEAVADPADAPPAPREAAPFGKLWNAVRLAELLAGPGPLPAPRGFVAALIEAGGEKGERERLRHQSLHGWPNVTRMDELAANRRGWLLTGDVVGLEAVAAAFEKVRVGGDGWNAWQAEFARRGWPWLPDPGGHGWVYLPAGGPEEALGAFGVALDTIEKGKQDHDEHRPEAAE